jgi:hypothetical protein
MRDGRHILTKPIEELTTQSVIRAMVGRDMDALFPKLHVDAGNVVLKVERLTREGVFTDVSFDDPQTQYGIGQAYVTIAPDLGYENMRLSLKVGAYQDRYGAAGKYDAGEYDTYMFGRTHVMGETLRAEYDISESWGLWAEEGIGGKRPDPSSFNNARFTMLAHGHVGLNKGNDMQFSAHMLYSWAQEEDRPYNTSKDATVYANSIVDARDGNMWVAGADARFDLGAFGYLYGGYSHIGASNALVVGRALEVLG